jgi:hypothetical protein
MSTAKLYHDGKCVGILTLADTYEYGGFRFEISYGFPQKINKDGEPSKRLGDLFWSRYYEWQKLSKEDQEKYRV